MRCIRENHGYTGPHKLLIMALALTGRAAEARSSVNRLRVLEPGFTVQGFRSRFQGRDWPIADLCCDALEKAGVPVSD